MISGILGSGLEGLSRSREGLNQSAKTIASGGQPPVSQPPVSNPTDDMLTAVVDLNVYELQFKASAKVISTANESVGTLLDEIV
ncbi:flagellar biosynthesis protein FlgE [Litoribacillus peritrichatus]|uniref:Flagellar hook protein FlgE n=1 Tax=Litoribacillus peritrichatus TaxID=718191 RepID=A0ABP7LY30_9GAMM